MKIDMCPPGGFTSAFVFGGMAASSANNSILSSLLLIVNSFRFSFVYFLGDNCDQGAPSISVLFDLLCVPELPDKL